MAATPWRTLKAADAEREYLVVLTYLPLRHLLRLPEFLWHLLRVKRQLAGVQGLGTGTRRVYEAVRGLVPPLLVDRSLGADVERLAGALGTVAAVP